MSVSATGFVAGSGASIGLLPVDGQGNPAPVSSVRSPDAQWSIAISADPAGSAFTLGFAGQATPSIPVTPAPPLVYGLWTVTVSPGVPQQVAATWPGFPFLSAAQLFEALDSGGTTLLGSATVDMTHGPVGFVDGTNGDGSPTTWQVLGTFTPTGTTLRVRCSAPAGQLIFADGLRVRDTGTGAVRVLDDAGGAYAVVGASAPPATGQASFLGSTYTNATGTGAGPRYTADPAAIRSALLSLPGVPPGGFTVQAADGPGSGPYAVAAGGAFSGTAPGAISCADPAVSVTRTNPGGDYPTIKVNGGAPIALRSLVWGPGLPDGASGGRVSPYAPWLLWVDPAIGTIAPSDTVTLSIPAGWYATPAGPGPAMVDVPIANRSGGSILPAVSAPRTMAVGYNLTGENPFGTQPLYSNIAKRVEWGPVGAGGIAATVDADGYPTALNGPAFNLLAIGATGDDGGAGLGLNSYPDGPYTFLWDGACVVTPYGGGDTSMTVVSGNLTGAADNRIVCDFRAGPSSIAPSIWFTLHATSATAPYPCDLKNLRIYRGDVLATDAVPTFDPSLLAKIPAGPGCLRFLDPLATNSGNVVEFSDLNAAGRLDYFDANRTVVVPIVDIRAYAGFAGAAAAARAAEVVVQFTTAAPHGLSAGRCQYCQIVGSGTAQVSDGTTVPLDGYSIVEVVSPTVFVMGMSIDGYLPQRTMTNVLTSGCGSLRYQVGGGGMAFTDCVALCNLAGKDLWLNVPPEASDACVAAMASHVAARLGPGLRARVEYANECWNFQFAAYGSCCLKSISVLGNGPNSYGAYYVHRMKQVHDLFAAAMTAAGRPGDLVRVLGSKAVEPGYTSSLMLGAAAIGAAVDAVAVAPYFSNSSVHCGNEPTLTPLYNAMTTGQDLDLFELQVEYGGIDTWISGHRSWLDANGFAHVEVACYEGGPEFAVPRDVTADFRRRNHAAVRHPRMFGIMLGFLEEIQDAGATLFNDYYLNGGASGSGAQWGAYIGWDQRPGTGDPTIDAVNISAPEDVANVRSEVGGAMNMWASLVPAGGGGGGGGSSRVAGRRARRLRRAT